MVECNATRVAISDLDRWLAYRKKFPGEVIGERPEPPFIVSTAFVSGDQQQTQFVHSFISCEDASKLLALRDKSPLEFVDGEIRGVFFEVLKPFEDERGWLCEMVRKDDIRDMNRKRRVQIDDPTMTYISLTKAGMMRGPHEHLLQTDIFIFLHSHFELFLWDARESSPTYRRRLRLEPLDSEVLRVIVPPGVVHAYRAIDKDGLVVNCPDKLYKGWQRKQKVDEVRWENRPDSPFQVW